MRTNHPSNTNGTADPLPPAEVAPNVNHHRSMMNSIVMALRDTATESTTRIRLRYCVPMVALVALASSHVFTPATAQTIELPVSPNSLFETGTSGDSKSVKLMVAEDNVLTSGGSNSSHTSATVSPATLALLSNDALPVLQTTDVADKIGANDKMLEAISAPHGTQHTMKVWDKKAVVSTVSEVQMAVTRAQPVWVTAGEPTVTITGPDGPVTGPFDATITFSEPVMGITLADITVGNGDVSFRLGYTSSVYPIQVRPSASGLVTVDVVAGGVNSISTGEGNLAAPQYSVQANLPDLIPTVEIEGPAGPVERDFGVRIKFSEPVTGFDITDITVGNGAASDFFFAGAGFGGSYTYDADITPAGDGPVTVDVAASVAEDATGNSNEAADTYTVTANKAELEMTMNGPSSVSAPNRVAGLTFGFSSTVDDFDGADIAVTNGTLSAITGPQILLGKRLYRASVTAASSSNSSVTVDVAASANFNVTDQANDPYAAPSAISIEFALASGPTVTITGPDGPVTGPFDATITFSEAVTGFAVGDITVGNGVASNFRDSPGATEYQATITPATSGEITVDVAADVASATSTGIGNAAAERYTVQAELGLIVRIRVPGDYSKLPEIDVRFYFSSTVKGFERSDIEVTNGTVLGFNGPYPFGSNNAYFASILPDRAPNSNDNEIDVTIGLQANHGITDDSDNPYPQPDPVTERVSVGPTVTISGPSGPVSGPFDVTITFSEAVTGFDVTDITVGNSAASNLRTSTAGIEYQATITPWLSRIVVVEIVADVVTSTRTANGNIAARRYTVQAELPAIAPSVTITGPDGPVSAPFDVTIAFSEVVTGFAVGDITVGNGVASNFRHSPGAMEYQAAIAPATSGEVTVDVAADVASTTSTGIGNAAAERYTVQAELGLIVRIRVPGDYSRLPEIDVRFYFSSTVKGFERSDIEVTNGTVVGFRGPYPFGSYNAYFASILPDRAPNSNDNEIDVTIGLQANHGITDDSDNPYPQPDPVTERVSVGPTVTISGPSGPVSGPFDVTITFSEAVTGFDVTDITVGNSAASNLRTSTAGIEYQATITPRVSRIVVVEIAADVVTSTRTANGNIAARRYTVQADLPGSAPTVTITGPDGPVSAPFDVTIAFSEVVTGFDVGDITVGNGVASNFRHSPGAMEYQAAIAPATSGEVTVDVAADVASTTSTGIGNAAAERYTVQAILSGDAPTVTITGLDGPVRESFDVTITFSEAVTGFDVTDITVGNGTASNFDATNAQTTFAYQATITPTEDGLVTVDIDANAANSAASSRGNSAATKYTVQADVAPTVLITGPRGTVNGSFAVNITFDDNVGVTGLEASEIEVSDNATVENLTPHATTRTQTYTATIVPESSGQVTVHVPAGVVEDTADNPNKASNTFAVTVNLSQTTGVNLFLQPTIVSESSDAVTVTVTAVVAGSAPYGENRSVTVSVGGSGRTGVVQFASVLSFTLAIPAGNRSATGTFILTPTNNTIAEDSEIITVSGVLDNDDPVTPATLTLIDDDGAPADLALSVSPTVVTEDAGATTVTVTAMVEGGTTYATDQRVGVTVSGSGNSGVVGFDPVSGFDITVPAGEATGSATFTLTPEDNVIYEADETITITGAHGETSLMATLKLTDDDAPPTGITLSVNPVAIDEDAGATTVTVTATVEGGTAYATDQRVGVTVSESGNSGVVGFDPVSGFDITVLAGEATGSATFALTPEDNVIDEADETITITGTHGETSFMATLTLTDDDAPPTGITPSVNPVAIDEDAGATTVTVSATVEGGTAYATDQRVGVTVSGSGNSGVVGFDPVSGFDITVPAGEATGSATFTLTPEDNVIDEADETITITGTHSETSLTATLTLIDDDAPPTGITLSVTPVVIHEDAGAAIVTVTAMVEGGTAYATDQRVGVTVSGSGNSGVVSFDPVSGFDITVPAGEATGSATFTLTPEDNVIDEADETITITGTHGETSLTATLTLTDDDAPPTGITLSVNPVAIDEGAGATTVTVTTMVEGGTAYATDQRVGVIVSGSGNSGVVGFDPVSGFDITVPAGEVTGSATFTLTPEDNVIDEADEIITITGTHGETSVMATLTLIDDDAPPTGITLSVNPVAIDEDAGATTITVTAMVEGGTAYATDQRVGVTVSGSGNSGVVGFDPAQAFDIVVLAGTASATGTFVLTPVDNRVREADETVSVTGSHSGASSTATLMLIDDDAAVARYAEVSAVILPELTRAMTASSVGAVAERIRKPRMQTASNGMALRVGGHTSLSGFMGSYRIRPVHGGSVPVRERLRGTSFAFSPVAGLGGRITLWGEGDYRAFSGGNDGIVGWDGSLSGIHLGVDADVGSGVLVGLAVSRTDGSVDYTYSGSNLERSGGSLQGVYASVMQSVHPYLSWSWSPGSNVWASAGFGGGEIDIQDDEEAKESSDSRMSVMAAGVTSRLVGNRNLIAGGSTTLDLKSEAWQSRVELDDNGSLIDETTVDVNRLRLALEGAYNRTIAGGGVMTPFVELGLRSDGGDGQTGLGMELGGGLRYARPASGLTVEGRGRTLLAHAGDIEEWGVSGTIGFAPGSGGRGMSFRLGTSSGSGASGLSQLWSDRMVRRTVGGHGVEPRLNTEFGYGIGLGAGVLRPYSGVEMSELMGMSTRVGMHYRIGPRFNIGVEVEHRALPGGETRAPMLRGTIVLS